MNPAGACAPYEAPGRLWCLTSFPERFCALGVSLVGSVVSQGSSPYTSLPVGSCVLGVLPGRFAPCKSTGRLWLLRRVQVCRGALW